MKFILLMVAATLMLAATPPPIPPSDPRIQFIGRVDRSDPDHLRIAYPGVTLRFRFTGDLAVVQLTSEVDDTYVTNIVEGGKAEIHRLAKGPNEIEISAADIGPGPHTVEIVKRTEPWQGTITFNGIRLGTGASLADPLPLSQRKLLFIGDSVTCGAGIDNWPVCPTEPNRHSNGYDAYGMVLGRHLDAQAALVCYGGRGVVRDYLGHRNVLNAPQFFNYSIPADDPAN